MLFNTENIHAASGDVTQGLCLHIYYAIPFNGVLSQGLEYVLD